MSDALGLSPVGHPEVPGEVENMSKQALGVVLADYSHAAEAADRRASGSVPAAGLLSIASSTMTNHSHAAATGVIVASAVTILMALFATNAQVEPNPDEKATACLVKRANEALRRKVAWAQLSSYFAFGVAVAVGVLAITT